MILKKPVWLMPVALTLVFVIAAAATLVLFYRATDDWLLRILEHRPNQPRLESVLISGPEVGNITLSDPESLRYLQNQFESVEFSRGPEWDKYGPASRVVLRAENSKPITIILNAENTGNHLILSYPIDDSFSEASFFIINIPPEAPPLLQKAFQGLRK